jgi:hypothetical protein
MSIEFACPSCDRGYKVGDHLAGRTVKCKSCGEDMTVPGGIDDDDGDERQAEPEIRRSSARRKKSSSGIGVGGIIGIVIGALLAFGLPAAGFLVNRMMKARIAANEEFGERINRHLREFAAIPKDVRDEATAQKAKERLLELAQEFRKIGEEGKVLDRTQKIPIKDANRIRAKIEADQAAIKTETEKNSAHIQNLPAKARLLYLEGLVEWMKVATEYADAEHLAQGTQDVRELEAALVALREEVANPNKPGVMGALAGLFGGKRQVGSPKNDDSERSGDKPSSGNAGDAPGQNAQDGSAAGRPGMPPAGGNPYGKGNGPGASGGSGGAPAGRPGMPPEGGGGQAAGGPGGNPYGKGNGPGASGGSGGAPAGRPGMPPEGGGDGGGPAGKPGGNPYGPGASGPGAPGAPGGGGPGGRPGMPPEGGAGGGGRGRPGGSPYGPGGGPGGSGGGPGGRPGMPPGGGGGRPGAPQGSNGGGGDTAFGTIADPKVVILFTGKGQLEEITSRLKEILGSNSGFQIVNSGAGGRIEAGPVEDFDLFLKCIDFGKVTKSDKKARTVTIRLNNKYEFEAGKGKTLGGSDE